MTDLIRRLNAALEGRYRVERQLGEGGMATVYLANDLKHDRKVAVKVLKPELAAAIGGARFLEEIRTTAHLHHPHILPLFDSGEADGFLFYAMPHVEGESLRERLDREGQLPVAEAVAIATNVANALHAAHEHGVIHRDIKPANILLAGDEPLVADFGIALAAEGKGGTRLTDTGMSIGTPAYMSPEQGLEGARLDRRADIYSLGCVLYEMLVGDPPFPGSNAIAMLVRKSTETAPGIRVVRETVSPELEAAVLKALARIPADRFATAGELAESLSGLGASARLEPAGAGPRSGVWTALGALNRRVVLGTLTAAIALMFAWQVISGPAASATLSGIEGLAIMPLENFGGAGADLVSGLHAEVIAEMQRFERPQTRSRHSVARFATQEVALPDVGTELGVEAVTTGFVRLQDETLSLHLSLMQVRPVEVQLWSGDFSAPVPDAYELVGQAVLALADELALDLSAEQASRLRAPAEFSQEAQTLYQRARALLERLDQENALRNAIVLLDSASSLEPAFAEALAWESLVHSWMWWWQFDPTDGRLALADARADSALSLSRSIPEPHMAKGFIRAVQLDPDGALELYEPAYVIKPNDPDLNLLMGMVIRDQGDIERGAEHLVRGATIDPTSSIRTVEAALTLMALRDWPRVLQMVELAEAAEPVDAWASFIRARVHFEQDGGDPTRAIGAYRPDVRTRGAGPYIQPDLFIPLYLASLDEGIAEPFFADSLPGQFHASPGRLEMTRGVIHWYRGDTIAARREFELAASAISPLIADAMTSGRLESELLGNLGIALAALGRWSDAPEAVVQWLNRDSSAADAYAANNSRARIWTLLGDHNAAIAELGRRLGEPNRLSTTVVRVDPWYGSLRGEPAFQRLLEGA